MELFIFSTPFWSSTCREKTIVTLLDTIFLGENWQIKIIHILEIYSIQFQSTDEYTMQNKVSKNEPTSEATFSYLTDVMCV